MLATAYEFNELINSLIEVNRTPTASQPGFLLPLTVPAKTAYNKSINSRRRGRRTGRRRRGSMINKDKLKPVIEKYKTYFPTHWRNSIDGGVSCKWEAVKCFREH